MEVQEGLWITLAERDYWRHDGWWLAVDGWRWMVDENQNDDGDSGDDGDDVDGNDHGDAGDALVTSNGRSWYVWQAWSWGRTPHIH